MHIYGQFTKIEALDDGTIKVIGVASSGAVDDADETVLPSAMKAALPSYMRFGALREMHGLSAAGATLHAEVDEDGLTRIETHVIDPLAVKKVRLGVYKGFSIGGKVLERDAADRRVITKIKLDEISLVDRPCNPEAVIDMWKAERAHAAAPTNAEVIARAKTLAAEAGKPGRHTEFVVKARDALVLAAAAAPASTDFASDFASADGDPDPDPHADSPVSADPTAIADRIDAILDQLDDDAVAEVLADLVARRGLEASPGDDADDPKAGKAALASGLTDTKRFERIEKAAGQIDDLRRTVALMQDRIEKLAAQPMAPKAMAGLTRAVSKTEDAAPGVSDRLLSAEEFKKYLDALPEEERGQIQLRAALRSPVALAGR